MVEAVHGEGRGGCEDGRVRARGGDVARRGGVDEGGVEGTSELGDGVRRRERAVRAGPVFRKGEEGGGVGERVDHADGDGRAAVGEARELDLHARQTSARLGVVESKVRPRVQQSFRIDMRRVPVPRGRVGREHGRHGHVGGGENALHARIGRRSVRELQTPLAASVGVGCGEAQLARPLGIRHEGLAQTGCQSINVQ